MCGISAIFSKTGLSCNVLHRFNSIIRHRGPDDEGYLFQEYGKECVLAYGSDTPGKVIHSSYPFSPNVLIESIHDKKFNVGLGHRRLSIIDTSPAGHNPLSFSNNRYWITFNGEIYNYLEIKQELEGAGVKFRTQTDTEVILAAYEYWGSECLNQFMGMWSFVIFDAVKNMVFAARDRFGMKPFYYYFDVDDNLYISSEIKQFTTVQGWKARDNQEMVLHYLINSASDHTEETFFKGVSQLRGGQSMTFSSLHPKDMEIRQWYKPRHEKFQGGLQDAVHEFRQRLYNAVELHLRSDVTVGAALSGGLDSSSVVCIVDYFLKKNNITAAHKTFSSCSIYEKYDERKWMNEITAHLQVESHFIYPKSERVFPDLANMIWTHEIPYDSQSAFLGFQVFEEAKRNGVKVLLNGQGADEYLGGYSQFFPPLLTSHFLSGNWKQLVHEISSAKDFHSHSLSFLLQNVFKYHTPHAVKEFIAKVSNVNKFEISLLNIEKFDYKTSRPFDRVPIKSINIENTIDLFSFYNPLPKYLRWEDRNSMANSIEARIPFLDHRLFEFAKSLPVEFIQRDGQTKWLLREATKGVLPEKVRLRKDKKGFITPEKEWVLRESRKEFTQKLHDSIELTNGLIKPDAVNQFQDMLDNKVPFNQVFWRIMLLGEWYNRFNVE